MCDLWIVEMATPARLSWRVFARPGRRVLASLMYYSPYAECVLYLRQLLVS